MVSQGAPINKKQATVARVQNVTSNFKVAEPT